MPSSTLVSCRERLRPIHSSPYFAERKNSSESVPLRGRRYSTASWPEPFGWSTSTPSGSRSPVSQAKSEPARKRKKVSFERVFSAPVGTTIVSPGKAAETASRRRAV